MADTAQDRTLPATERRIRKARADGQVARSRDLGHLAALGGGGLALAAFAPTLGGLLGDALAQALRFDAALIADPRSMVEMLSLQALQALKLVLGLGAAVALAALAAGWLAGGWNFTLKPLAPKFGKLNPLAGIGRLASGQQLTQTLKACLLALVFGAIGAVYLHGALPRFAALLAQPLPLALAAAGVVLRDGLALLLLALAAFAIVDVPLERWLLMRRLRMSHEEVKQEQKEAEGNVEMKSRIRARMRALANRRMLAAVPGADIVVMNPSHFAVALKYDEASMGAPRVVAKGADLMALRIRDAARAAGVPVLQAPPLARALYAHAEVDAEIPAALFAAVAQVLAWVFQLRTLRERGAVVTIAPPLPEVPPGLDPGASAAGSGAAA